MYLTFCGIGITNAKLFELSAIEFNRNRVSNCMSWSLIFSPLCIVRGIVPCCGKNCTNVLTKNLSETWNSPWSTKKKISKDF